MFPFLNIDSNDNLQKEPNFVHDLEQNVATITNSDTSMDVCSTFEQNDSIAENTSSKKNSYLYVKIIPTRCNFADSHTENIYIQMLKRKSYDAVEEIFKLKKQVKSLNEDLLKERKKMQELLLMNAKLNINEDKKTTLFEKYGNSYENNSLIYLRPYGSKAKGKLFIHIPQSSTTMNQSSWSLNQKVDILTKCLKALFNENQSQISQLIVQYLKKESGLIPLIRQNNELFNLKLYVSDAVDIIKRLKLSWQQLVLLKRFLKSKNMDIFPSTCSIHAEIKTRNIKSTYVYKAFELPDNSKIPAVLIENLLLYVKECWQNLLLRGDFVDRPEYNNYVYIGNKINFIH